MSRRKNIYSIISLILILCLTVTPVRADKTVDDIRKEQEDTKGQLDAANEEIGELTEIQKGITEEIEALDDELVEVIASVSMVEDEIEEIKGLIEQAEIDLAAAIEEENTQYEAMKKRIKYMYEKGDVTYLQLLMESKNAADIVNKQEYISKLYDYDRKMLIRYQAAKQAVADAKAELEEQQEELEVSMHELEEEKNSLNELLEEKKAEAEDYEAQIAKAKQDAAVFKAKIKQQNAQIKKLEEEAARKKAEEEAARKKAEEEARKAAGEAGGEDAATENGEEKDGDSDGGKKEDASTKGTEIVNNSGGSARGREIASFACRYVGNPYVAGGTSLTDGCDCSGFTTAVFKNFGINLPRTSTSQRGVGRGVTYAEAQPGDIICYAGHVAIYIGNGQIVHASTPSSGIKYGSALYKPILSVRRVVE